MVLMHNGLNAQRVGHSIPNVTPMAQENLATLNWGHAREHITGVKTRHQGFRALAGGAGNSRALINFTASPRLATGSLPVNLIDFGG